MSTTPTTNYAWLKPTPGTETDTWGNILNNNYDSQDTIVKDISDKANGALPQAGATAVGGTADAITATFSPAFTAYTASMRFRFTAGGANTITNPTINVDGLGVKTIKKLNGAALSVGDIAGAGHVCDCTYDGVNVVLLNPSRVYAVNQDMGTAKFTNLGAGSAALDSAQLKQVQDSIVSHATVVGGTADAITATFAPAFAAYTANMRFRFTAGGANTVAAPTINVDGLGLKTIKKLNGAALTAGNIAGAGHVCDCVYDGVDVLLLNPADTGEFSGAFYLAGDISPAQITADQNNYNPPGLATASTLRISSDNYRVITGLAGGVDGRILTVWNIGTQQIDFSEEDGLSTAANRFRTLGANWASLYPGGSAVFQYDGVLSRWRILVGALPSAGPGTMEAGTSQTSTVSPGLQRRHPGHPKFYAFVTMSAGVPTLQSSYNVASITDTGVGLLTLTLSTPFSSNLWACIPSVEKDTTTMTTSNNNIKVVTRFNSRTASAVTLECTYEASDSGGGGNTPGPFDPASWSATGLGDQ